MAEEGPELSVMDNNTFIAHLKEHKFAEFAPRATPSGTSVTDYDSDVYKFDYPYRGLALIIVDEKDEKLKTGYIQDKLVLKKTFGDLGFDVVVLANLKAVQMYQAAKEASTQYRHGEADCFVCILLVHGDEHPSMDVVNGIQKMEQVVFGVDRGHFPTSYIISLFNDEKCPALKDKPRMFFIQACRGFGNDDGVSRTNNMGSVPEGGDISGDIELSSSLLKVRSNPLYQDCLIMYSSSPGYESHVKDTGSWFVNELCRMLQDEEVGSKSFVRVLTYVAKAVAEFKFAKKTYRRKQMPVLDFQLIKDIYMTKKERTS